MTFQSNKKLVQAKVQIIVKFENELQPCQKVFWEKVQKKCQKGRGKKLNLPHLDFKVLQIGKNWRES
jgi:hypothetical protein